jgi:beta-exotoxin I transport system permease protein
MTMLRSVFGKTLYEARRSLLAWSLGVVALVATLLAMYPTVRTGNYQRTIEQSSEGLLRAFGMAPGTDIASGAGYLGGYLFGFMLPLLLIIFAVSIGAREVAGEEDAGTLDVLATLPISRARVVAEKFAAFAALALVLGAVADASVLAGAPLVDLRVAVWPLIVTTLGHVLVAVLFGAVAMAAGAATGSRSVAIGAGTVAAAAAYLVNSLTPLSDRLEPLRRVSPLYWATGGQPLPSQLTPWLLLILAASAVALVPGAARFGRRDLNR